MVKKVLMASALVLTLGMGTATAQSTQQKTQQELAATAGKGGVEVFSDTTAADTSQAVPVGVRHGDTVNSLDDAEDVLERLGLFTGALGIGLTVLVVLVVAGVFFLPVILLVLLLVLLLRRRQQPAAAVDAAAVDAAAGNGAEGPRVLRRSDDRVLGGVCAGLAEYLNVDTVALRLIYACLTLFTAFSGIVIYLIAWLVIPARTGRRQP